MREMLCFSQYCNLYPWIKKKKLYNIHDWSNCGFKCPHKLQCTTADQLNWNELSVETADTEESCHVFLWKFLQGLQQSKYNIFCSKGFSWRNTQSFRNWVSCFLQNSIQLHNLNFTIFDRKQEYQWFVTVTLFCISSLIYSLTCYFCYNLPELHNLNLFGTLTFLLHLFTLWIKNW